MPNLVICRSCMQRACPPDCQTALIAVADLIAEVKADEAWLRRRWSWEL